MKKRQELLSRLETTCRSAGLKLTHQRFEVYTELARASDHPSPEALYRRLIKRIPSLSLDTVYRTLATFEQHGLTQKVETVQSQVRFEAACGRHHHMICSQCHEIADFLWPLFDATMLPKKLNSWGKIERKGVVVYGVCGKCRKKQNRKRLRKNNAISKQNTL